MDNAARFLRFVLPGLVFTMQIIIALSIVCSFEYIQELLDVRLLIGLFFSSGVAGYIFSIIYYFLHWRAPVNKLLQYLDIIKTNRDLIKKIPKDIKRKGCSYSSNV